MLTLFFLPPYSPDLNPDEWVWKNVKHDNLGRAAAKSTDDLARFARAALDRLKSAPHIIRRILRRTQHSHTSAVTPGLSPETLSPP